MPDNRFDGKKVSRDWDTVLTHARRMGVRFRLNSGRRTMAEQMFLWRNRGKPGFARIVAFPQPNAPHIRVGRQAHAIDVDTSAGGESHLQSFLARKGLSPRNTVRGEPWHLEVNEAALRRYARSVRKAQQRVGH